MEGDGGGCSSNNNSTSMNMNMNMNMMMPPPPPIISPNSIVIGNDHTNNNTTLFLPHSSHNNNNNNNTNFMENNNYFNNNTTSTSTSTRTSSDRSLKAKIMFHPHFHRLLSSYVNCQKVGAPADVVARLEQDSRSQLEEIERTRSGGRYRIGEDPGLDQFMEAYCEMLTKYEQEISKPFKEAMLFLSRIDSQLKSLTFASSHSAFGEAIDRNGSSEEELDVNVNNFINPQADDSELKGQLLRKYSGYLGSLKQEFLKKKKKGKLPKEARQQLLDWWIRHYKWPYPSESQKMGLAESTGLDQKQINNWFINQRKRHWKPSEEMQFVVMDAAHPHYYMDNNNNSNNVLPNAFPMDISPGFL